MIFPYLVSLVCFCVYLTLYLLHSFPGERSSYLDSFLIFASCFPHVRSIFSLSYLYIKDPHIEYSSVVLTLTSLRNNTNRLDSQSTSNSKSRPIAVSSNLNTHCQFRRGILLLLPTLGLVFGLYTLRADRLHFPASASLCFLPF